jgi:hypothetical protein
MGQTDQESGDLQFGTTVYDADGEELGQVRGFDESGFYVSVGEGTDIPDVAHDDAGSGDTMWRCWECGEMGTIERMPDACPACGAGREDLYYWKED